MTPCPKLILADSIVEGAKSIRGKYNCGVDKGKSNCGIYGSRVSACTNFKCLYLIGFSPTRPSECGILGYHLKQLGGIVIAIEVWKDARLELKGIKALKSIAEKTKHNVRVIGYGTNEVVAIIKEGKYHERTT